MYTALVCLVLFDARGECPPSAYLALIAAALATLTLAVKYFPVILHRPQMIDVFCEDVLSVCAHCVCTSMVPSEQNLQYACALHSALHLLEHRFLGKPRVPATLAHTMAGLLLAAAYAYGPRTLELRPFIVAVAYPNLVELLARALAHVHRMSVLWLVDF